MVALVSERHFREARGEHLLRIARDSYSYLHLPMIAGIVLVALGIKKAIGHVDDPLEDRARRWPCSAASRSTTPGTSASGCATSARSTGRALVAAVACLALIPLATEVDAIWALALAAAVTSA